MLPARHLIGVEEAGGGRFAVRFAAARHLHALLYEDPVPAAKAYDLLLLKAALLRGRAPQALEAAGELNHPLSSYGWAEALPQEIAQCSFKQVVEQLASRGAQHVVQDLPAVPAPAPPAGPAGEGGWPRERHSSSQPGEPGGSSYDSTCVRDPDFGLEQVSDSDNEQSGGAGLGSVGRRRGAAAQGTATGYTGVRMCPRHGSALYDMQITIGRYEPDGRAKNFHLFGFATPEDAARARDVLAIKRAFFQGRPADSATLNFPFAAYSAGACDCTGQGRLARRLPVSLLLLARF